MYKFIYIYIYLYIYIYIYIYTHTQIYKHIQKTLTYNAKPEPALVKVKKLLQRVFV